jgi:hypothetical protein
MTLAYQMSQRCRAKRSDAEIDAMIARLNRERDRQERRAERTKVIEKTRARDGWFRQMVTRAVDTYHRNRREGLVEAKVAPGPRWTKAWFDEFLAHRVPNLRSDSLPSDIGVTALLFAVERLEERQRRSGDVRYPAAFIIKEIHGVMSGKRTVWVSPQVASEAPEYAVENWRETYAGRMWLLHEERLKRTCTPEERKRRGLQPFAED